MTNVQYTIIYRQVERCIGEIYRQIDEQMNRWTQL